jgi:ribosome-associated protein
MIVQVKGDCIRLGQFLKIADIVGTGGEAKIRIQSGDIKVNGITETRRGLQMKNCDVVEADGMKFIVEYV